MAEKQQKEVKVESLDYNPDILPVDTTNYEDKFLYWKSIERINVKQIKWLATVATTWVYSDLTWKPTIPTVNIPKLWHFQITATGNIVVTWIGYKPSLIEIKASVSWWSWILESTGKSDWTNTYTHYIYNTNTNNKSYYVTDNIIVIEDGSSWSFVNTYASLTSLDSGGFTVNVWTRNHTVECTYIVYP